MRGRVIMLNFNSWLLHAEHGSHDGISELLSDKLGVFGEFLDEVIIHGVLDTLKLVLILFLTYLLMEFIEHRASDKVRSLMRRAGNCGPLIGGLLGAVPQCGFSLAASNLYTGRVITLGTLVAVFLSTSDEMLPILLAGNIEISKILLIILYKCVVGVAVGFIIDITIMLMKKPKEDINIDEICDNDNCHCERGIFHSALHHTLTTSLFVLIITVAINAVLFFIGDESIENAMIDIPIVSHFICALVGLIPNCAASVALTKLAMSNIITSGAMMSGLFSGAGVGLLVLFRMNKRIKENITVAAILVISGIVFGAIADLIPVFSL